MEIAVITIEDLYDLTRYARGEHPGHFVKFNLEDAGLQIIAHYWGGKSPGARMIPWALLKKNSLEDLKTTVAHAVGDSS